MEMTVMTYNIQSGRNLAQDRDIRHAISTIRKESPVILSLNEVQHCTAFCPDGKCQAQAVAEALDYPYFRFGRSIDYEGGEYGNALLSRYPILESAVFPVPDVPEEQRDGWFEPRTHLFCRLDLGGTEMIGRGNESSPDFYGRPECPAGQPSFGAPLRHFHRFRHGDGGPRPDFPFR